VRSLAKTRTISNLRPTIVTWPEGAQEPTSLAGAARPSSGEEVRPMNDIERIAKQVDEGDHAGQIALLRKGL
jgi:hypothetical protein